MRRIAVMGAGGVGGYLGIRLAQAGQEVKLIARGQHLEAIRGQGLRLDSPLGDVPSCPLEASDDPAAIGPVDLVLFTVKLYDMAPAAEACRPLIGPDTAVLTLLNGVDSPGLLEEVLGPGRTLGGVAQISAQIAAPGAIRHHSAFARFVFGELTGQRTPRVLEVAQAFEAAGIEHQVSDDIRVDIWQKMVLLAAMSGVTSLVRLPIGPIREEPATRALLSACAHEAVSVARAHDISLADDAALRAMAFFDAAGAEIKSSMLVDLERGRRLELPWLSGAIVRLGAAKGVPTPTHTLIEAALRLHQNGPT